MSNVTRDLIEYSGISLRENYPPASEVLNTTANIYIQKQTVIATKSPVRVSAYKLIVEGEVNLRITYQTKKNNCYETENIDFTSNLPFVTDINLPANYTPGTPIVITPVVEYASAKVINPCEFYGGAIFTLYTNL